MYDDIKDSYIILSRGLSIRNYNQEVGITDKDALKFKIDTSSLN